MASISTTFLVATDSALTISFGGYEDLIHYTDLSDNPQDLAALYIGSLDPTKTLYGSASPGVTNITITPTDILPKWQASQAYTLGQCIQPLASPDGYRYQCTTAGTSGSSEPGSWPGLVGTPVTTGTAVFTCISPKHALTEVVLGLASADLATNTPGAALSLGNHIDGGVGNAIAIYLRVNNGVDIVSNNTAYPEIGLQLNGIIETA